MLGLIDKDFPVHASKAFLCASFQSVVPSSCRMVNVVSGDLVDISALMGELDVIFWYRNGIPISARRTGLSRRNVEMVLSGSPENPTRVPRRVYRSCEGERETERREYGEPRISKEASALVSDNQFYRYTTYQATKPKRICHRHQHWCCLSKV